MSIASGTVLLAAAEGGGNVVPARARLVVAGPGGVLMASVPG